MAVSPSQSTILEAHRLMQAGRLQEALVLAEPVVDKMLICDPAQGMLATIFLRLGRRADAELSIEKALQCEQGPADAYDALAHVCMLLGRHERSNALYRRAVELAPNDARHWYNLASSERSLGRLLEAENACDRAIELDPSHYRTYLLRSELRVQAPDSNHIAELHEVLLRPGLDERARVPLGYALAKELDDLARYDEAFHWFQEAASIRRRHLAYDVGVDERKLERIREVYPPELVRQANGDEDSSRHIFIIGLPRSGTTLLEHILMRLAHVRSNGETDNFLRALLAASPSGPQDVFSRAAAADSRAVAAHYAKLADENVPGARMIEKLPLNYLYLGAIHRALPRAKLLLVRRSALDSCFAMYRTLFGAAYPFTYDFADLARYYAAYEQLMNHWRGSLGDALIEVEYEDLVRNPQDVGARVARHCNLLWDPHAIEIDKGAAVSLTASAAQIRRPIYGSSSGRWRHYRKHLEPLISALRRHQVALPEDA